jgi:uncharacterized RDD family membrane protein YckC
MEPLVSGEAVRLALAPAGVGTRVIAAVLDAVIQFVALILVLLIDIPIAGGTDVAAFLALLVTEVVLILAGYPIVMEWLSRGRTLGKMALGLRVVRDDGGPIAFRHALVRGLSGFILEKPGILAPPLTTIAGLVTMAFTRREKRIGDLLAGTIVLNERSAPQQLAALPPWVPPHLQPWVLSLDLHRFDDRLALSTRQFVSRAHEMTYEAQHALGEDLRRRVLAVVAPPPPPHTPTPALLMGVLAERRRRATVATGPGWPPPSSSAPVPHVAPRPPQSAAPDQPGPFAPPG